MKLTIAIASLLALTAYSTKGVMPSADPEHFRSGLQVTPAAHGSGICAFGQERERLDIAQFKIDAFSSGIVEIQPARTPPAVEIVDPERSWSLELAADEPKVRIETIAETGPAILGTKPTTLPLKKKDAKPTEHHQPGHVEPKAEDCADCQPTAVPAQATGRFNGDGPVRRLFNGRFRYREGGLFRGRLRGGRCGGRGC